MRTADLAGWDCLRRGALSVEAARTAPYLAELKEASPFTDWLLDEATTTYPGWGLLSVSPQPLLRLREHFRSLGEVITPDGERRAWRWWDPDVLQVLLPGLLASQLDEVFGAGQTMIVLAADVWTWLTMEEGVLVIERRPILRPMR